MKSASLDLPEVFERGSIRKTAPPQHVMEPNLDRSIPALSTAIGNCFLESSPDCIGILDLEGNLIFMNRAGAALMEIDDLSDKYSKPWLNFWPEENRSTLVQALRTALSGIVIQFNGICHTCKGNAKWWDVVLSPVKDSAGALTHLMIVSRDVTSQKATEKALAASAKQFRALADNIFQLAWMADANGYIFWFNQRWFDYTGATLEEMVGWGWRKAHHPDYVENVVKKIKASFESGENWEDTFPLRGADGCYRWFLSRARPIRDEAGHVTLWCGTNTDVTDLRNYRLRLDRKARLIDLSHEAILVRNADSEIELWNSGCAALYGFSRDEAIAFKREDFLKTRYPVPRDDIDKTLRETGTWSGELLQYAKDGSAVWVESRQQLLNVEGRCVILESNRDITERRAADEFRDLLNAELNHRVKNTLAIVQAVASQTARRSTNFHQFLSEFNGRLQSLSSAHNLLTEAEWSGVDIRKLVENQVLPELGENENVVVSGEGAILPAQTAIQLALILHELTTNAQKYGALSTAAGRVDISWSIRLGPKAELNLVWREFGGPQVKIPASNGFGTTLINRSKNLTYLGVKLRFEPEGVVCEIAMELPGDIAGDRSYFDPRQRPAGRAGEHFKRS